MYRQLPTHDYVCVRVRAWSVQCVYVLVIYVLCVFCACVFRSCWRIPRSGAASWTCGSCWLEERWEMMHHRRPAAHSGSHTPGSPGRNLGNTAMTAWEWFGCGYENYSTAVGHDTVISKLTSALSLLQRRGKITHCSFKSPHPGVGRKWVCVRMWVRESECMWVRVHLGELSVSLCGWECMCARERQVWASV